jgi:hypothetical protein
MVNARWLTRLWQKAQGLKEWPWNPLDHLT